jgi:heme/copper-type cytochrome/quinol oxidase subunit 2
MKWASAGIGAAEGKMILRSRLRIAVVIAALAVAAPAAISQEEKPVKQFDQAAQVIVVTAGDFQFTPSAIHIKAGQNTQIQVTSKDKTHGIRINPFPDGAAVSAAPGLEFLYGEDCWKLKKNVTVKIELIGHTPGTYIFSCCKSCGSGHKRMKGQIIVDP